VIDVSGAALAQLRAVQMPGLFCGRIPGGVAYRLRIGSPAERLAAVISGLAP
jgi:hypothetical protein